MNEAGHQRQTSPPEFCLGFVSELMISKALLYSLHRVPGYSEAFSLFFHSFPVQCNSIGFGFGSMNDEYTLPCSSGYTGSVTARCQPSGWQVLRETCVLSQLEELKKVKHFLLADSPWF